MVYQIAVVQNSAEALRYSQTDTFNLIKKLFKREEYKLKLFDNTNIEKLLKKDTLKELSAIIIASNAFQDKYIRNFFYKNQKLIIQTIEKMNIGLIILHQYNADYVFYHLKGIKIKGGVKPEKTQLIIEKDDIVLQFPYQIDLTYLLNLKNQTLLDKIYWNYFENWPDEFIPLIKDRDRALLLKHKKLKIIISTIPFDFLNKEKIIYNMIKFVVEGNPKIVLVYNKRDKEYFIFEYIKNILLNKKIAFIRLENLNIEKIKNLNIKYIIINKDKIKNKKFLDKLSKKFVRILIIEKNMENGGIKLSLIGNYYKVKNIIEILEKELLKSFDKNVCWNDSIWDTYYSALFYKYINKKFIEKNKEYILNFIFNRHYDEKEGNIDGSFGPSCIALKLTLEILNYQFNNEDYNNKIKLIYKWLNEKYKNQNLYEKLLYYQIEILINSILFHKKENASFLDENLINKIKKENIKIKLRFLELLLLFKKYKINFEEKLIENFISDLLIEFKNSLNISKLEILMLLFYLSKLLNYNINLEFRYHLIEFISKNINKLDKDYEYILENIYKLSNEYRVLYVLTLWFLKDVYGVIDIIINELNNISFYLGIEEVLDYYKKEYKYINKMNQKLHQILDQINKNNKYIEIYTLILSLIVNLQFYYILKINYEKIEFLNKIFPLSNIIPSNILLLILILIGEFEVMRLLKMNKTFINKLYNFKIRKIIKELINFFKF